jgi:cytochrome c-type biogenesis protein CcmF
MEPALNALVEPQAQNIDLFFGNLGHFFVLLAFVASLISAIAYYQSSRSSNPQPGLQSLGRWTFRVQLLGIFGVMATMFAMIFGHHFEYHYVWQHSSKDLPFKYILSCFWEGQEGSFLLWAFWVGVLGNVFIFRARSWESSAMFWVAGLQAFLLTYILGVRFGGFQIGNSPFLLLEDVLTRDPVMIFDDYMRFVQDGTGLNALLQNYWMVIHPPVLFLGFASTVIPFAIAMAALTEKRYTDWITAALPWAAFSGLVLGAGILMGGRWAYESLSFGGFWAWDPVENASLVPWLIGLGALHTMQAYRHAKRSLRSSFLLTILAFYFVLISSYLTRSGVLGDTSVHSFVDAGLNKHLLIMIGLFGLAPALSLIRNWKAIPTQEKEEPLGSREFWLFMAGLIFLFASIQIIIVTSVPAFNQLFAWVNSWTGLSIPTDIPTPEDPAAYYNSVQIWVASVIALLIGFSQFLRYKSQSPDGFFRSFWSLLLFSLSLTIIIALIGGFPFLVETRIRLFGNQTFTVLNSHLFLLLAGIFACLGNLLYLFTVLNAKSRFKVGGASVAHIGFGLMLVGILWSNAQKQVISENRIGIDYGEQFDAEFKRENILLQRNLPTTMGDYQVTYLGDSAVGPATYYKVRYQKIAEDRVQEEFVLEPFLLVDKKTRQQTPNPATRHYLSKDVFTHVSATPNQKAKSEPSMERHKLRIGDTAFFSRGIIVFERALQPHAHGDTMSVGIRLLVQSGANESYVAEPSIELVGNSGFQLPARVPELGLSMSLITIDPETQVFDIGVLDQHNLDDWVILKAIIFPQIRLVWAGSIIMFLGFFMAIRRRQQERQRSESRAA